MGASRGESRTAGHSSAFCLLPSAFCLLPSFLGEIAMRRALRRGGWALSLTAGLSLTAAAAAQPPAPPAAPAAGKTPPAQTAAHPAAHDPNRVQEINVE